MMDGSHSQDHVHCQGELARGGGRRGRRVQWDTGAPFPEKGEMNDLIVAAPCISLVISVAGL